MGAPPGLFFDSIMPALGQQAVSVLSPIGYRHAPIVAGENRPIDLSRKVICQNVLSVLYYGPAPSKSGGTPLFFYLNRFGTWTEVG